MTKRVHAFGDDALGRHDGVALAELLVQRARPLYPRYGLTWRGDLASVVAMRLGECLRVDVRRCQPFSATNYLAIWRQARICRGCHPGGCIGTMTVATINPASHRCQA